MRENTVPGAGTTDLASCGYVFMDLSRYERAREYLQLVSGTGRRGRNPPPRRQVRCSTSDSEVITGNNSLQRAAIFGAVPAAPFAHS